MGFSLAENMPATYCHRWNRNHNHQSKAPSLVPYRWAMGRQTAIRDSTLLISVARFACFASTQEDNNSHTWCLLTVGRWESGGRFHNETGNQSHALPYRNAAYCASNNHRLSAVGRWGFPFPCVSATGFNPRLYPVGRWANRSAGLARLHIAKPVPSFSRPCQLVTDKAFGMTIAYCKAHTTGNGKGSPQAPHSISELVRA